MIVKIKLSPTLCKSFSSDEKCLGAGRWEMPEGCSVGQVLDILKLPEREAKLFFLNGERARKDKILQDGDELQIFPPIGGG